MKRDFSDSQNLLLYLKKGNTQAYTYLVDLYYKDLCDYAKNLSRDGFRAEDIVQNVIIKLWQQRKNLKDDISIRAYLYKAVYHEFIDQYRKEVAITALEKKYIEYMDQVAGNTDEEEVSKIIALLEREIDQLPPKCKETFLLSKKSGLTYTEIAKYQSVSVNTVEKQMVKAFSILRKKLGDSAKSILLFLSVCPLKLDLKPSDFGASPSLGSWKNRAFFLGPKLTWWKNDKVDVQ